MGIRDTRYILWFNLELNPQRQVYKIAALTTRLLQPIDREKYLIKWFSYIMFFYDSILLQNFCVMLPNSPQIIKPFLLVDFLCY